MVASVFSMAWNKVVMRAFLMVYCGISHSSVVFWQWKTIVLHVNFGHLTDALVLSTTWNDLFCSCVEDVSILWQMFNFVFLSQELLFQFNSGIVRTHFARVMSLNNWKMIAKTWSYILRWRLAVVDVMFALPSTSDWWDIPHYTTSKVLHN